MTELVFSPLTLGKVTIKNRIVSSAHDTVLPENSLVNEALIAYHKARAQGGVGLIIVQATGVHESARYTSHALMVTDDEAIEGFKQLADTVHAEGCKLFVQLFHPGREIMNTADGLLSVAYSASLSPNERFHVMPRPLSLSQIASVIDGYVQAAQRLAKAGVDGVEIAASHGYLPSQFLNPRVNKRDDIYGGSLTNRLRFTQEVIQGIRGTCPDDFVVGLRISGDEFDPEGLNAQEALEAGIMLQTQLDYISLVGGTSASLGGSIHIVPPMTYENGYLADMSARFKQHISIPIILSGRINQVQEAEHILQSKQADACIMTRALICDPLMPNKAQKKSYDTIRACIACNQSCIGRFHRGLPISCIQNPQTGRELRFKQLKPVVSKDKVMVVGGGPAGMKAASIAAQRGFDVVLFEASPRLGGQVNLAQLLPHRAEFGGMTTNLEQELKQFGVEYHLNTRVDQALVEAVNPKHLIIATGAKPFYPVMESMGDMQVVTAWDILKGDVTTGKKVVVVDWRSDWIGAGIAIRLAQSGCQVTLAVNAETVGQALPMYVRDSMVGELHQLGVIMMPYSRLYGHDDDTVYLQHTASGESVILDGVDTLVLSQGHQPVDELLVTLTETNQRTVHPIGDCLSPRTAEEAIFDGMNIAWHL